MTNQDESWHLPRTQNPKPRTIKTNLRIFLTGVGGQGTLLASRLLGEAALAAGYNPMVSETHGMAQRGGIVVSTVILGDLKSPLISPGEADIVLGFEALEAFRALDRCHAKTLVIANTATQVPYPVAIGQARYPSVAQMFQRLAAQVGALWPSTPGLWPISPAAPWRSTWSSWGPWPPPTPCPFRLRTSCR